MRQFPPKFPTPLPIPVEELRSYPRCDLCKTELYLYIQDFGLYEGWIHLRISRYFGNLNNPRDPDWLAQTFAKENSSVDDYYHAAVSWADRGYRASESPIHLEPENGSFFPPITLPGLLPSLMSIAWDKARSALWER